MDPLMKSNLSSIPEATTEVPLPNNKDPRSEVSHGITNKEYSPSHPMAHEGKVTCDQSLKFDTTSGTPKHAQLVIKTEILDQDEDQTIQEPTQDINEEFILPDVFTNQKLPYTQSSDMQIKSEILDQDYSIINSPDVSIKLEILDQEVIREVVLLKCNQTFSNINHEDNIKEECVSKPDEDQDPIKSQTHTGEKPFPCTTCNLKFSKNRDLRRHMITHTGEKPYPCKICDSKFTRKGYLKLHMMIHTGEKPFVCTICNSKFTQIGNLRKHMTIHTGEKSFQCSICGTKFAQKAHLGKHMRTHTKDKPYECNICCSKFPYKHSLQRHIRTHNK